LLTLNFGAYQIYTHKLKAKNISKFFTQKMSQTKREQEMRFDLVYRLTEVLYESFLVANFIDFID